MEGERERVGKGRGGRTSYSKPIGGGLDNSAQNWRWATKIQRAAGNHVIGRLGPVGMPLFLVIVVFAC